jgi:hypothetical protein
VALIISTSETAELEALLGNVGVETSKQGASEVSMNQVDKRQSGGWIEINELVQSGKRALCGAFLLVLALSAAALFDLRLSDQLRTTVALAAGNLERDTRETSPIREPGSTLAYAPTTSQGLQTSTGRRPEPASH